MSRPIRDALAGQRGSVLLFTTVALVFILVMGGLAVDFAYQVTAKNEVQRSMDAAALAGASQLNWTDAGLTAARAKAITYAGLNPYRGGTVDLGGAGGAIVFGTFDSRLPVGSQFVPTGDATQVNAISCTYATTIRTSLLNLLDISTLPVQARAIAAFGPPSMIPQNECLFPIGVSQCPFQVDGRYGPQGCGQPVSTFTPSGTNVAAWANIDGPSNPSASRTRDAVAQAAGGACSGSELRAGDRVGVQNGMVQSVFDSIARCDPGNGLNCDGFFVGKFNTGTTYTVKDAQGNVIYSGRGWQVVVPVVRTSCPAGPINQDLPIATFSKLVITQVINRGWCTVNNTDDPDAGGYWRPICPGPIGNAATRDSSLNAIIGYFNCTEMDVPPIPDPSVPAALATRMRLVK